MQTSAKLLRAAWVDVRSFIGLLADPLSLSFTEFLWGDALALNAAREWLSCRNIQQQRRSADGKIRCSAGLKRRFVPSVSVTRFWIVRPSDAKLRCNFGEDAQFVCETFEVAPGHRDHYADDSLESDCWWLLRAQWDLNFRLRNL